MGDLIGRSEMCVLALSLEISTGRREGGRLPPPPLHGGKEEEEITLLASKKKGGGNGPGKRKGGIPRPPGEDRRGREKRHFAELTLPFSKNTRGKATYNFPRDESVRIRLNEFRRIQHPTTVLFRTRFEKSSRATFVSICPLDGQGLYLSHRKK